MSTPARILLAHPNWVDRPRTYPGAVLFDYTPGDDLLARGAVFARATTAYYQDGNGFLQQVASGVIRDQHCPRLGSPPCLLLEGVRTNLVIRSNELATGWTANNCTLTNAYATRANVSFSRVAATVTGGAAFGYRSVGTFGSNGTKAFSMLVCADTGNALAFTAGLYDDTSGVFRASATVTILSDGSISATATAGVLLGVVQLAQGVVRILMQATSVTGAHSHSAYFMNAPSVATSFLVAGMQVEDAPIPSSYYPTAGATLQRNGETLNFPISFNPRALSMYLRCVEQGNAWDNSQEIVLAQLGSAGEVLELERYGPNADGYRSVHQVIGTGGPVSEAAASSIPNVGDTLDLLATLTAAGGTDFTQSRNGGALESGVDSGTAFAPGSAWGGSSVLILNGINTGSSYGVQAIQAIRIVAGIQTLDTMRGSITTPAGRWAGGMPSSNVQDRRLARLARTLDAGLDATRLEGDLGQTRPISLVAVPRHTMSQAAKARVLLKPDGMLFDYEAGDDIAAKGGVFTRGDVARYHDINGLVQVAGSGVPRDAHFIGGLRTLLLEAAGTNLCLRSQEVDNATWGKADCSVGANADIAPDGTLTADRFIEAANNNAHYLYQPGITITANGVVAFSIYAKAGSLGWILLSPQDAGSTNYVRQYFNLATGAVGSASVAGGGVKHRAYSEALANGWFRFTIVCVIGGGVTNSMFLIGLADADGDFGYAGADGTHYISLWGAQAENAVEFSTSYIPTTSASVTRPIEELNFPFITNPQTMTVYSKHVERGTALNGSSGPGVWGIGGGADAAIFTLNNGSNFYSLIHRRGTDKSSTLAATPDCGDTVELRSILNADGSVQLGQSVNGAAEVVASASAASSLGATWNQKTLYINARTGGTVGWNAFQSLRVAAGVQTLAAMQALVYDSGWLTVWPAVYPANTLPTGSPEITDGKMSAENAREYNIGLVHLPFLTAATYFNARYWSLQMADPNNAAGYVDVARLFIGLAYQPTINPAFGAKLSLETDTLANLLADVGGYSFLERPKRRVFTGTIEMLATDEALVNLFDLMQRAGINRQVFFVFDPNDTVHMARRAFLGTFKSLGAQEFAGPTWNRVAIEVREDLA